MAGITSMHTWAKSITLNIFELSRGTELSVPVGSEVREFPDPLSCSAILNEEEESANTLIETPGIFIFLAIFFDEEEEPADRSLEALAPEVAVIMFFSKDAATEVLLFSMVSEFDHHNQ